MASRLQPEMGGATRWGPSWSKRSTAATERPLKKERAPANQPGALFLSRSVRLQLQVAEVDEGRTQAPEGERVPEPEGARNAAHRDTRERLLPTALHVFADQVRAVRQIREHVVTRRVAFRHCTAKVRGERDTPVRKTSTRRGVTHLAHDRQGPRSRQRRDCAR